jgi:hypothetical protein
VKPLAHARHTAFGLLALSRSTAFFGFSYTQKM